MGRVARLPGGVPCLAAAARLALLAQAAAADEHVLGATASAGQQVVMEEPTQRRRLSFGTITADAGNPTMSGSPFNMPMMPPMMMDGGGGMPVMSAEQQIRVSRESTQIVQGMVRAFLHKTKLQPGERDCIAQGSGLIGGNIGRVAGQFYMILKQAFGPDLPELPGLPGPQGPGGLPMPSPNEFGAFGDGAGSISDMVAQIQAEQAALQGKPTGAAPLTGAPLATAPLGRPGGLRSARPPAGAAEQQLATAASASAPRRPRLSEMGKVEANQEVMRPATKRLTTPDPGLALFYGSRRLQLVPAMPETSMAQPGMGMMGVMGGGPQMGGAFPIAVEVGFTVRQIVTETQSLVGRCVHSDAKAAFLTAADHMRDLKYVTGHFLANGADVLSELADSVMAYEHKNLSKFGYDLGKALRKVFLSNHTSRALPEGLPGEEELSNVTTGLMQGFFGKGTTLDIKFDRNPSRSIHVDMQRCVSKNLRFFQQVWATTLYFYAQTVANAGSHHQGALSSDKGKLQFGTELAFTMMQVPKAMRKCHINSDQEKMIVDALKALGAGMHWKFHLPIDKVSDDKLANDFAKTVQDWSELRWQDFGYDLGVLMQEMVVTFFPRKYSVVDSARLRNQLIHLESEGAMEETPQQGVKSPWVMPLVLVLTAVLLLAALVALKGRKTLAAWQREWWADKHGSEAWETRSASSPSTRPLCRQAMEGANATGPERVE